ncbi:M61 family metallopeptidase [Pedobacter hartonius]|uniref:Predicted metalloprotease, contains C-terminal PDZ domain n=1 Tax=Pedobacter hartonius TaxID=425514 RepID=A0A1H4GB63_9SPHI|nr:M61 family metallopeptidase [Pedobacter hartonius]SEB06804.1 Predicted metalloprotease, contains C-terminal PDZ domain [Pedobacter hartonius]
MDPNTWLLDTAQVELLEINYDVTAVVPFIGNIYLDENFGYIIPGALLLYIDDALRKSATIEVLPYQRWPSYVATGLNPAGGKINVFYAVSFDELFDSPLLMGKLEALPEFKVQGKIHQFVGHGLEEFDRKGFMYDLQKIVQAGGEIIGDIPYSHYSFLAIPTRRGFGGIEHLNSASLMLATRNVLSDTAARNVFYAFLAHEYFHTYNVKRIRPIELGPFDYSRENYTNLLWISGGFSGYYQYLIVKAAGLTSNANVLEAYRQHIANYENKPGHLLESAAQASHNLWAEGEDASSRSAEQQAKTISVYDKGCAIGLMLDLKIWHETQNCRTLDDVMRRLYVRYDKQLHRGFTEQDFWSTCESIAGTTLTELKSYANTTAPPDYPKYFSYAGLNIDTVSHQSPGAYLSADAVYSDSRFFVSSVEWPYGGWKAGIIPGDQILSIDGGTVINLPLEEFLKEKHAGETVMLKGSA